MRDSEFEQVPPTRDYPPPEGPASGPPGLPTISYPAWVGEGVPSPDSDTPAPCALSHWELLAVIRADLIQRWNRHDPVPVENYLQQHPDLRGDTETILELITTEVLLRRKWRQEPRAEEYLQRFPDLAAALRALFAGAGVPQAAFPTTAGCRSGPADSVGTRDSSLSMEWASTAACAAPDPEWPAVPGYLILGELGHGGMGVVYKARQLALNRTVALKMIRDVALARTGQVVRFRTEAEAVARLEHPHIVHIYEIGEYQGRPFFSLEFVHGGTLAAYLHGNPMPPAPAAELVETLARAMHVVHQHGVIHRDLKPANVLLERTGAETGRRGDKETRRQGDKEKEPTAPRSLSPCLPVSLSPKITDFGLAKRLDDDSGQTGTGDIMGTPSYMAPEQALGQTKAIGPATDVYALGAILYELLTGRPPFKAANFWDTVTQVVGEEPVRPRLLQPKTPADLETICLKCLRKEPARRYPSAEALADDLRRFRANEPIQARPVPFWERSIKWARRRPMAAALVVAVAVTGASLVAVGLTVAQLEHQRAQIAVKDLAHVHREQARLEVVRGETVELIAGGREALARQQWGKAEIQFAKAVARLSPETSLTDLRTEAHELLGKAQQEIEEQNKRTEAGRRHRDSLRRLEQVLHQGMMMVAGRVPNLEGARQPTRPLLDVLAAELRADLPLIHDPLLGAADKEEIRDGCHKLLMLQAEVLAGQGDGPSLDEVLRILDRVEQLGPPMRACHQRRAECLQRLGRHQEAHREETRAAALSLKPQALDLFLQGERELQRGHLVPAGKLFKQALHHRPTDFWTQYFLALCYLQQGRSEQAQACLTSCLGQKSDFLWCYLLRGFAHGQQNEVALAEEDFRRALELNEKAVPRPSPAADYSIHVNRAALRLRQHQFADAVADLEHARRLRPDQYPAYARLAEVYRQQKQFDEALRYQDRAIDLAQAGQLEPAVLAPLYRFRARLYVDCQDPAAALADWDRLVRLPREPMAATQGLAEDQAERGRLLHRLQRFAEAQAAYAEALQLDPGNPGCLRRQGGVLIQLGRYAEATAVLDRYLAAPRPDARAYFDRGVARAELGHHAEAIVDFTHSLGIAPTTDAYAFRGWEYLVHEAPKLALADFEEALKLDKEDADAFSGRGYARAKLGQLAGAGNDAEEALRRQPARPRLVWNAARIFAIVTGRLAANPAARGRPGLRPATYYQDRAVQLLSQAVELNTAGQRPAFWQQYVEPDLALHPIRSHYAYQQLAQKYGSRSAQATARPK